MPTYKYRREDGSTFTIRQRITEDALEECPETGQKVERVITGGSGFHLKGGGWYKDGYASPGAAEKKEAAAESSGESGSSGKADAPSESSGGNTKKDANGAKQDKGSDAKKSNAAKKDSA